MMPPTPRVSVLMPVRNGLPWLPAAIESIRAQTFIRFELIVLEDGSSDGTVDYLASVDDPRLRIIPTHGVGIARALNVGVDAARAAYVARHDADDESRPDRFARQVAYLDAHPDVDVVASTADYMDAAGATVSGPWVDTIRAQQDVALTPEAIAELMPLTCCVTHGSIMARRGVMRVHGYAEELVPADDYDLWLRLLPYHRIAKLPERLYRYRLHDRQLGATRARVQTCNAIRAKLRYLRRTCRELPERPRLAMVGSPRGNEYYESVAHDAGFDCVSHLDDWDVLAVTDFATIDARHRALSAWMELRRIGNCLVQVGRHSITRVA